MKLSIVIPVYNEAATITGILQKVKESQISLEKEIIVVDDCSTDGTSAILDKINDANIKVFHHQNNQGKGSALKTGFGHASGDIVIIQDADSEYDPHEYNNLLGPILNHGADVVYGSRLSGGKPTRVHMFWHKAGNTVLTFLTNILYNTTITDMETGYKVFKKEVIAGLNIKSKGFDFEPEITAKIFKKKYIVYEVPISYYGRSYTEGKKIRWYHAISAVWALVKYKFTD